MNDLVVIILTLLILVVGIVGQLKKKREPLPNPNQQSNPPDFWGMIENKMQYEPDVTKPEVKEETAAFAEPVPKAKYTFSTDEGKSAFENDLKKVVPKTKKTSEEEKERFSLRKAVIYSEILNRKYS
ncbi:MAG: hypothetical protein J7L95_01955 [Prolixibacteraceae bacterium]|nr:hypothetical protein [Prolixibacteraceae bacterium]